MAKVPAKIGKYTIEDKIAEGGMGAVFKGIHPTLEQPVVLKKLTLRNNEQVAERFRREAKIMIDFSHENIVRVYDHFKQASSFYIVQEFVDGCSVDILLKKERYLDINAALYIFYHAALALQYAHSRQVIHRDIKPANIMVSRTGEIKLVDFGIAQSDSEEDTLTRDGMTLGTPSYMAPEQFEDSRNVTCQADIYSLGVMLYEMVTGKKPFPGKMNPETVLKIQKGRYTSPKKLQPELPGFVASIIRGCMKASLKKRTASIEDILKKMKRWYNSAPLEDIKTDLVSLLSDEGGVTRLGTYRKQTKKTGIFVAVILLILLIGGGAFAYAKGMHYRYLLSSRYGGFQVQLQIPKPAKRGEDLFVASTLFIDDNAAIPDINKAVRYKLSEETDDMVTFLSSPVYLPPGAYRLKTVIDSQVIWKNIYLKPMKMTRSLRDFGSLRQINLSWTSYHPLPLKIDIKPRDRKTGKDLSDIAVVEIMEKNAFVPIDQLASPLMSDNVYKIRVTAEGYYSNDYHLRIQPYQSILQLDAQMVPVEGYVKVDGWNDSIEIRIDGDERLLSAGFPGEIVDLTEDGAFDQKIPLEPGEYVFSFTYKNTTVELRVDIEKEKTTVLKLLTNEKEKTLEISEERSE